jgi:hypothetical protein
MKIALVCIAKNEDNYIKEWVGYHKKLGFDDIFIYQNNWRLIDDIDGTHKIEFDGEIMQVSAYNHFISQNINKFDWVAFFDIDEFLVLKKHANVKDFILDYSDLPSIGINWVLFGNNGIHKIDNEYSVIKRFTKRQVGVNIHVKCIVKLKDNVSMSIHNPVGSWFDTDRNENRGAFNKKGNDNIAQLNHYFCKTEEEFQLKCDRGRADHPNKRTMDEFNHHNFNDVEDLSAYNFFYR